MAKDRLIETQAFARAMRGKIIRPDVGELLISQISGSDQEADLTAPPNSGGLGRVRHFRRHLAVGDWPANPLPLDPACKAIGLPPAEVMTTFAPQSFIRSLSASALNPLKTTLWGAPIRAQASIAVTASGIIGR